ncbi:hypothetical protein XENTR_v10020447 [Xenopus tropicalis]|nr:hypothetical protein XENTR_v10020447 [Xenopus tropicalis]
MKYTLLHGNSNHPKCLLLGNPSWEIYFMAEGLLHLGLLLKPSQSFVQTFHWPRVMPSGTSGNSMIDSWPGLSLLGHQETLIYQTIFLGTTSYSFWDFQETL